MSAASSSGCEAGAAPATVPPGVADTTHVPTPGNSYPGAAGGNGNIDPLYIPVPLYSSPPVTYNQCSSAITCIDHPATIDLSRLASTLGVANAASLDNVPLPGHDHLLTTRNGDQPEWWNVIVIPVTSPAGLAAIESSKSYSAVRTLETTPGSGVGVPGAPEVPTNAYLWFQTLPGASAPTPGPVQTDCMTKLSAGTVVGSAALDDGTGDYEVDGAGDVAAFGAATCYGAMTGQHLNQPIVGMAVDRSTGGYWLVAKDGGVFSFNAPFYGSTGGIRLNQPVVGVTPTLNGTGYYLVASDGGVFTYGDATFAGSTGGIRLNQPVVGMGLDRSTGGYWLVAKDGGRVLLQRPLLRLHRWHPPEPTGSGNRSRLGRKWVPAGGHRRWGVRLQHSLLRIHWRHPPQRTHRRRAQQQLLRRVLADGLRRWGLHLQPAQRRDAVLRLRRLGAHEGRSAQGRGSARTPPLLRHTASTRHLHDHPREDTMTIAIDRQGIGATSREHVRSESKGLLTRRWLRYVLGLLWVLDGALQLQSFMFTRGFAHQIIAPAAAGQPWFVSGPVRWNASLIAHQPVLFDAAFAGIQLAIGVGLLIPRTCRIAIIGSVLWAGGVWYFGEGMGELAGGHATALIGAPGAALLYIVLAAAAWPETDRSHAARSDGNAGRVPHWLAYVWASLWAGAAVLDLLPGNRPASAFPAQLYSNARQCRAGSPLLTDGWGAGFTHWVEAPPRWWSALSWPSGSARSAEGRSGRWRSEAASCSPPSTGPPVRASGCSSVVKPRIRTPGHWS